MRTYKLTLGNGNVLGGLTLNGNNFVSQSKVTESDFADGLDGVMIEYTGDEELGEHEYHEVELGLHDHMKLIYCKQIAHVPGYYFVLCDYDASELKELQTEARIDYLEMMIDE